MAKENTPPRPQHENHFPHIGLRKIKSILAIFVGFWLWQLLRLFLPGLEMHPIFIYIYGVIEIRDSSEKTKDYGVMRIKATFTAILIGLPIMLLSDWIMPMLKTPFLRHGYEVMVLLLGTLFVLVVAEAVKCRVFCGVAAIIFVILMVNHFEGSMYLYSLMRAFQTLIAVFIAWLINVVLLPYPAKPKTLSYWLAQKLDKST